jgi:hypothetical protein
VTNESCIRNVAKYLRQQPDGYDVEMYERAQNYVEAHFLSSVGQSRLWTHAEAIAEIAKLRTSPGRRFAKTYGVATKAEVVAIPEACAELEAYYENELPYSPLATAAPKEEVLPSEKVLLGEGRSIVVMAIEHHYCALRLLGDQLVRENVNWLI